MSCFNPCKSCQCAGCVLGRCRGFAVLCGFIWAFTAVLNTNEWSVPTMRRLSSLDFVFFPCHNTSCLKCCPANYSFIAKITWIHFQVDFNPVLCLSAPWAALSHRCCLGCHQLLLLQFWLAVWCCLSARIKACFFTVNLIKGWMLDPDLVTYLSQHEFIFFRMNWSL